jgi:hypothetical protein
MHTFIFFIVLLWTSFCFAKVEICVEGPNGWAEKLPTWKLNDGHILSKIFYGGRPMTGYHVWANVFIFSILHVIYIFQDFSKNTELRIISFFILFWVIEDFLWFVLNPAFGIKKFKKENIWWHRKNWWLFAPREYFIFIPLAAILLLLSF